MRILVTGARGNVGSAVLRHLDTSRHEIFAAGRQPERIEPPPGTTPYRLDFGTGEGIDALPEVDCVFLLRPPSLPRDSRHIVPLLDRLRPGTRVIFLSLQDADKKRFIPHQQIERAIVQRGLPYVSVRPTYFMENLVTTLYPELQQNHRIFLPAGGRRNNWIAVDDIGQAVARIIEDGYPRSEITLTSPHNLSFGEVVDAINRRFGLDLRYESPHVLRFCAYQLRRGTHPVYLLILLMINYLPRFGPEPPITSDFRQLMGRDPAPLETFLDTHSAFFEALQ